MPIVTNIPQPTWITPRGLPLYSWGGIEFCKVQAGQFLMGSWEDNRWAREDEKPADIINIPYDYWMGRFPVTNEQYTAYAGEGKQPVRDSQSKKEHPVGNLSWNDAMAYCMWMNDQHKTSLPEGLVFHLPTEAEWEKAARTESGREWPWGNEFDKDLCNSFECHYNGTSPVGMFSPRGDSFTGCADMAGNVQEWCLSLYRPYPYKADDGREAVTAFGDRILRGGGFYDHKSTVRCASRDHQDPDRRLLTYGFRLCVSPISFSP